MAITRTFKIENIDRLDLMARVAGRFTSQESSFTHVTTSGKSDRYNGGEETYHSDKGSTVQFIYHNTPPFFVKLYGSTTSTNNTLADLRAELNVGLQEVRE